MSGADPTRGPRRQDKRASAYHQRDVPVDRLLRDAIVGITCFPDPLPRGGKRKSRRWWRHANRP
jgi:hypothetical protein